MLNKWPLSQTSFSTAAAQAIQFKKEGAQLSRRLDNKTHNAV
jgi:hypothetical protein